MYHTGDTHPSMLQLKYGFPDARHPGWPVPQIDSVPPEVLGSRIHVVQACMDALNRGANYNNAFRYFFNTVAMENFAGPVWLGTVTFATLFTWVIISTRPGISYEAAVREASDTALLVKTSEHALGNHQVMSSLDAATQADIANLANEGRNIRAAIDNRIMEYMRSTGAGYQHPGHAAPPQTQYASTGMANIYSQPQQAHQPAASVDPMTNLRLAAELANTRSVTDVNMNLYGNMLRDNVATQPVQEAQPVQEGYPTATVTHIGPEGYTQTEVEPPRIVTEADWHPTYIAPYKSASFGRDHTVDYVEVDGVVMSTVLMKDEDEMNREDLAIPVMNVAMQRALDAHHNTKSADIVVENMDLLAGGIRLVRGGETPAQAAELTELGLVGSEFVDVGRVHSLNQAISIARAQTVYTQQALYTVEGQLCDVTIPTSSEIDTKKIKQSSSYSSLATAIHAIYEANPDVPTVRAAAAVNKHVTGVFNKFVNVRVGIPGFVDSYVDDNNDHLRAINEHYGRRFHEDMVFSYKDFIAGMVIDTEVLELPAEATEGDDKVTDPKVVTDVPVKKSIYLTRLMTAFTLTLIDMVSTELAVSLTAGEVRSVFPENYPGLFNFISSIVDTDPNKDHYIVTADDVVYGVAKSIVGDKPYVIYMV